MIKKIGYKVKWVDIVLAKFMKKYHKQHIGYKHGCQIIDISPNGEYHIRDYDNLNEDGGCVETWVNECTFHVDISEIRDEKLNEILNEV